MSRFTTKSGIHIELYKASFKVEGQSGIFYPAGGVLSKDIVEDLVEGVYQCVKERAIQDGKKEITKRISNSLNKMLDIPSPT